MATQTGSSIDIREERLNEALRILRDEAFHAKWGSMGAFVDTSILSTGIRIREKYEVESEKRSKRWLAEITGAVAPSGSVRIDTLLDLMNFCSEVNGHLATVAAWEQHLRRFPKAVFDIRTQLPAGLCPPSFDGADLVLATTPYLDLVPAGVRPSIPPQQKLTTNETITWFAELKRACELSGSVGRADATAVAPKSKRPGRRRPDEATIQREAALADEWDRARECGVCTVDFARDKGMKVAELKALLDRVRKRRRNANRAEK